MLSFNLRQKSGTMIGGLFTIASILVAIVCGLVLRSSTRLVGELVSSEEHSLLSRIQETSELCLEHEDFARLLERKGQQSAESLYFANRCKRQLEAFVNDPRYEQLAPALFSEAHHRLGQLHSVSGDRDLARRNLEESIRVANAIADNDRLGIAYNTLGVILSEFGELQQAERCFADSASSLLKNPGSAALAAISLRNLSIVRSSLGHPDQDSLIAAIVALRNFKDRQILSPASEVFVDTTVALAKHHIRYGDISSAKQSLVEARSLMEQLCRVAAKSYFESRIVDYRRYEDALDQLTKHLEAVENAQHSDTEVRSLVWHWLYSRNSELIDFDETLSASMCGEFEHQSGLAVPWFAYHWAKSASKEIIKKTADKIQIAVICENEKDYYNAIETLESDGVETASLRFIFAQLDSPWLRDMGPISLRTEDGSSVWVDSHNFKDGMKLRVQTDALPRILGRHWLSHRVRSGLCIEGGSILANGKGLTICSSAIDRFNDGYGFSRPQIESQLRRVTGARELVFLDPLLDEGTMHIDMFATFCDAKTIVIGDYRDNSENAARLNHNADLMANTRIDGEPLRVVRIPMPPKEDKKFLSYTNVIYANGVLLVPSWNSVPRELEQEVMATYQSLLPDWDIVQIDCSNFADAGGALHCLTSNLGVASFRAHRSAELPLEQPKSQSLLFRGETKPRTDSNLSGLDARKSSRSVGERLGFDTQSL